MRGVAPRLIPIGDMRISEICTNHVITATADTDVLTAARMMREQHVGDVVIVEKRGTAELPIGVVTDRDIVIGALAQGVDDLRSIQIGDLVSKKCHVLGTSDRIEKAMDLMLQRGVRRIPVVNDRGELTGILSYDDLVAWMVSRLSGLTRSFANQGRREEIRRP